MKYVVATLLCCTGLAHASARMSLYERPRADDEATRRAVAVASSCDYSEMSRIGPSESQVARCNQAEQKLLALGKRAVPAALHALDESGARGGAVQRYYDVIARSGDLAAVEPLVAALEKLEANPDASRGFERFHISNTLERLTHAGLENASAKDWRAWADAHRGTKAEPKPDATQSGKPVG